MARNIDSLFFKYDKLHRNLTIDKSEVIKLCSAWGYEALEKLVEYSLCENDNIEVLRDVMSLGYDVNVRASNNKSILEYLFTSDSLRLLTILELLINHGVDVNAVASNSVRTPMIVLACENFSGDILLACLHLMVKAGADVNSRNKYGTSALLLVSKHEKERVFDIVKFLIDSGADVNMRLISGKTSLMMLCRRCISEEYLKAIDYLIEHAADVNGKDLLGRTALFFAHSWGLRKYLINKGADVNTRDYSYLRTLLVEACEEELDAATLDIIQFLVKKGADLNICDNKGRSALLAACDNNQGDCQKAVIKLLVEKGAYVNETLLDGTTPLIAITRNYEGDGLIDIASLLIAAGANVQAKNDSQERALSNVCKNYKSKELPMLVSLLIEHGADPMRKDNSKKTAIDYAKDREEDYMASVIDIMLRR